ncbi:MAG: GAF domain-containing protein, partial [Acidimicrobiia bacterium]
MTLTTQPLITQLLRFVRRADTERSATQILAEMSRFIAQTFSVYRVAVYVFEGTRLRPLVAEYASGRPDPALWDAFRSLEDLEATPLARRFIAGEDSVLVEDPHRGGFLPEAMVDTFGMRPYLAVPLKGGDFLQGVVLIEGDPDVLQELRGELSELVSFVTLAVENAQALAREQQHAREAEALLEVSAVLTRHTDLTPVLTSVAINCARVTGFERASIFLADEEGALTPTMSQFADGHADEAAWTTFRSGTSEVPACRRVFETGEPIHLYDVSQATDLISPEWSEPFGLRSILIVPLAAWDTRFGVMVLDHRKIQWVCQLDLAPPRSPDLAPP